MRTLPSPAKWERGGGEGRSVNEVPPGQHSHRLPSPPAPLPHAGEGSKPSAIVRHSRCI
ncbi:hypothetical protein CO2235_MP50054 [Cupriavidus oxalaticus]|uniref:Uncharacterized protein n=1 Tax=Cupriavidus oxalaticus TaxID=96344 RepID=A0A375GNP5_9BURK|nr:hypothetical protein CO2235_MP50054 [Cupriavidus oxalaticus]